MNECCSLCIGWATRDGRSGRNGQGGRIAAAAGVGDIDQRCGRPLAPSIIGGRVS